MRAGIIARFAPCAGFWKARAKRVNVATSLCIRLTRNPSGWPPGRTSSWSWDITKLLGPAKWTYFYLYVILDVFSRYVVGWMVADGESSELAKRLIADTCGKPEIEPGKRTIHADRGSSRTSKPVAFLMADLGITKTHSRPHVADDNPYSESHFRTLQYRPGFPERFGSLQDARSFSQEFFAWYNDEHRHSGLGLLSPAVVSLRIGSRND
jgi:putative transposase